jgi:hypothetical protein
MSSMRSNARLDTSHHGTPHACKYAGVVANSLTGIHNATVKCVFVVNRSCIHKGFQASPQVKIQRIQIWRGAWRSRSGSSSAYPSVTIRVTENISYRRDKMCRSTIMHITHKLNGSGHVLVKTFFLVDSKGFWRWCIILRITGFLDFVHRPVF